jgi:hypothetical protein
LVLIGLRQRRKSSGLRDTAEQLLRDLRP